jgi:hypothetical protein
MERQLESLPYIKTARVVKQYPGTLFVTIEERMPRALVFDDKLNVYVCIDDDGVVLDITNRARDGLPVMSGLRLAGYSIGKELISSAEGPNQVPLVTKLAMLLVRYGITEVSRVDISDPFEIQLFVNNVTICIGSAEGADAKILFALACLEEFDTAMKGTLYAYDSENAHFKAGR